MPDAQTGIVAPTVRRSSIGPMDYGGRRNAGAPETLYSVVFPSKCSSDASATFFVRRTIPSWCSGGE